MLWGGFFIEGVVGSFFFNNWVVFGFLVVMIILYLVLIFCLFFSIIFEVIFLLFFFNLVICEFSRIEFWGSLFVICWGIVLMLVVGRVFDFNVKYLKINLNSLDVVCSFLLKKILLKKGWKNWLIIVLENFFDLSLFRIVVFLEDRILLIGLIVVFILIIFIIILFIVDLIGLNKEFKLFVKWWIGLVIWWNVLLNYIRVFV